MKCRKSGFTIVELLTVVAVVAILVGLLVPALNTVRRIAKETAQRAQFTTLDMALLAFKGDYGDYPPSERRDADNDYYCGAQRLAEALMGQDLLGFHPDSRFTYDGKDSSGTELYPPDLNPSTAAGEANLKARRGPYLNPEMANAFKVNGLYGTTGLGSLKGNRYVLCDVYGVKNVAVKDSAGKTVDFVKAGSPILYYRANTTSKLFSTGLPKFRIYDKDDNIDLIRLGVLPERASKHKLEGPDVSGLFFYDPEYKIVDKKASAAMATNVFWPHRPDSYILISAGADGEYGTSDDMFNFGK